MNSTTTSQDHIISIEPEGENEASERAQSMVVRNSTTRLEQGAEAREVNEEGETFLHRAVASGKEQFVIELAKLMSAKDLVLTDRDGYTALHLAVEIGKEQFVIELVKLMSPEDLMLRNRDGCTALYLAAISGTKEMVKIMVEKNKALVLVRNVHELPVVTAARHENTDIVHYLYEHTPKEQLHPDKGKDGATLLTKMIISNLFDIALDLLEKYPTLAKSEDYDGRNAITVLARKPSAFPSGRLHGNWHHGKSIIDRIYYAQKQHEGYTKLTTEIKRGFRNRETKSEVHAMQVLKIISTQVSKMDDKQLKDAGVYEAVLEATKFGIVEFVYEVMKCNRHMANCKDASGKGPFLYAIMYRQEKIFSLLQNMRDRKSWFNYIGKEDGNNTLHQAAIYNRFSQIDRISGVALQIQRELQWFKEVEKLAPPILKDQHNCRGMTPRELFAEEHATLAEKGEKWMKETARGCMVVAALIATVVFTAAFTVPGGNTEENGDPKLLNSDLFMFFIIVDALSLFSSCSSMLIFLAILTSRYAEQDFLFSLPRKLILGLSSLFFSIGTMMAAFCATLFIAVRNKNYWVPITSTILALLPITLFIVFLCPLLLEMSYTTYGRKFFVKKNKVILF